MKNRRPSMVLTKIMEECGEVTQICSKIIFYGLDNVSPKADNPTKASNRTKLIEEMGDVIANFKMLVENTDLGITWPEIDARMNEKYAKLEHILPEDI